MRRIWKTLLSGEPTRHNPQLFAGKPGYAELESSEAVERLENWLTAIGDPDYTKPPVRQRHARPCSAAVRAWQRLRLGSA